MDYHYLGENIQKIRRMNGLKQQELADRIGVNLQSISKIERGINMPSYETFEKIVKLFNITPNELLTGEFRTSAHMETRIIEFLKKETSFDAEMDFWEVDTPREERAKDPVALETLRKYIYSYVNSDKRLVSELKEIKEFIQHKKFQKVLHRYEDYLCHDLYSETLGGEKSPNPYTRVTITSYETDEDGNVYKQEEYPDDFED